MSQIMLEKRDEGERIGHEDVPLQNVLKCYTPRESYYC